MKLYVWGTAPNPRRVKMFLAEKGITLEIEEAGKGAHLHPEFLAKNPHRMVPMLELDDGTMIGESMAICRYLEALHPENALFGTTPLESATIDMWERVAETQGMNAAAEVFRNALPAFAGRSVGGLTVTTEQIPGLIERGKTRFEAFCDKLDEQLAQSRFVAGERFSVADITALCAVDFAARARTPMPDRCTNLKRWHTEVSARPSAKG